MWTLCPVLCLALSMVCLLILTTGHKVDTLVPRSTHGEADLGNLPQGHRVEPQILSVHERLYPNCYTVSVESNMQQSEVWKGRQETGQGEN